jgi:hypothetical protein
MKGVVVVVAIVAMLVLGCMGLVLANPPLTEPLQYEQFCENQKVAGTGVVDISTSIVDKKIALEYYNLMSGDGDLELDQVHAYSQKAIPQNVTAISEGHPAKLNMFENTKLTYNSATTPLTGGKYLNSKAFYGGIGADVQETFSVNQMEKDQTAFFVSTADISPDSAKQADALRKAGLADLAKGNEDQVTALLQGNPKKSSASPYYPTTPCYLDPTDPNILICPTGTYPSKAVAPSALSYLSGLYPSMPVNSYTQYNPLSSYNQPSETTETSTDEAVVSNPVHVIGLDTKNSFNGTWSVDAKWHKIFNKDIKVHEMFTGKFEAEKLIKLHEYPVPEIAESPCKGIDC